MTTQKESILKQKIMRMLFNLPNSIWERIEQKSIKGTPDIIGCYKGRSFWLEVKNKIKKVKNYEKIQIIKLNKHTKAGGVSMILTQDNYKQEIEGIKDDRCKSDTGNE